MVDAHVHNGIDAPAVSLVDTSYPKQAAMTLANNDTISSGGAAVLSDNDADVINNMRQRINELENKLRNLELFN